MHRALPDMFIIGFALFSMFFGAGNVIFPPYLGLSCGAEWFAGFAWYYLADIGLALLALFAVLRCGSTEKVMGRLGAIPSKILLSAIVLCIGPMLAIPRTAATTLEMAVNPLLPGVSPLLFSLLFFALIAALCIRQNAVVDIVGKFLTPALLIGLLVLIVLGVMDPIGPVPERVLVESVAVTGIEAGYQTMDVLAAILFGIIILKSTEAKGYAERSQQVKVVAGAAIVAGIALLVVYLGLTYLGVTTSRFFDLTFWKFILVGVANTLFGTGIMFVFYNVFHFSYWVSSASNYIFGSILSYFLNKTFTFKSKTNTGKTMLRFVVNISLCYLLAYGGAKPLARLIFSGASQSLQENMAMLAGMCFFVALNYVGQRFFVFKGTQESGDGEGKKE